MTTDEKIDRLTEAVTEVRVIVAGLAGEVKAALARADSGDQARDKLEQKVDELEKTHGGRITALERWRWSIPSLAAVISVASLALAVYAALR